MKYIIYKGNKEDYKVTNIHPIAFGRTSVLFVGSNSDKKDICIKVFRDSPTSKDGKTLVEEFEKEVKAQEILSHPNILPVLDFGFTDSPKSVPFIVMPLCNKGNLKNIIKTRNYIPFDEAINLIEQFASAIDYSHRKGFVHGDIKPENILFQNDSMTPYLADFGVSKYFPFIERITTSEAAADSGGAGSTQYLSPEQIEYNIVSPLSDIYSFALVSYEILTGRLPFEVGLPAFQQMKLKVEGKLLEPIRANHLLTKSINNALLKGLEKNPSDRPRNAIEICHFMKGDKNISDIEKRTISKIWNSLNTSAKVTIITAIIAAIGGIIGALIKIIPELIRK